MPRMIVMLYVASLLCQPHRAGAKAVKNMATQPDDVFKKGPQCLLLMERGRLYGWVTLNCKKRRPSVGKRTCGPDTKLYCCYLKPRIPPLAAPLR